MFDDGYNDFCLHIVSLFERASSEKQLRADTYCGCVDHLEKAVSNPASHGTDAELAERA